MSVNLSGQGDNRLKGALADVTERFQAANPDSYDRWQAARDVMPGGNTRTVLHYDPFPVAMIKGEGAYLTDMDGHVYTDFLGEYSAGLYGHSNPIIQSALKEAIDGGTVLGAPNRWEVGLANLVCQRFPSIDQVRFTNSGTEANLMALGAARAFTKRDKIMVFDGAYHGGVLYFAHGGTPVNVPFDVVYAPYNDAQGTRDIIELHHNDLAAVIIEPMVGGGGCIVAETDFLTVLRESTHKHGIVLIFDEVMTSRSSAGGLQQRLGITPDMTTLGKYLGGGASFGGFGGRQDIMAQFDPTSPSALPHAGTFNNNVMSMAAGSAGLSSVFTPERANAFYDQGEAFKELLNSTLESRNVDVQITGAGTILGIHMTAQPIRRPYEPDTNAIHKQMLIHLEMMMRGFMYAQRGYMSLSLAITEEDQISFTTALDEVVELYADLLSV